MEYVEQGSLEDLLKRDGKLAVRDAVTLFREVAVGLLHAHGKGVLHCDLKPANVLLDQDSRPRLADFGQSRLSHEQTPALGTLFYMAPEQADLQAVPDVRWDVYALGALLFCMLTGAPPYRSEATVTEFETATDLEERLARYRQLIESSPPPTAHRQVPGVDRELADIVDGCLAADRRQRFANVQEVLDALDAREQRRARRPLVLLGLRRAGVAAGDRVDLRLEFVRDRDGRVGQGAAQPGAWTAISSPPSTWPRRSPTNSNCTTGPSRKWPAARASRALLETTLNDPEISELRRAAERPRPGRRHAGRAARQAGRPSAPPGVAGADAELVARRDGTRRRELVRHRTRRVTVGAGPGTRHGGRQLQLAHAIFTAAPRTSRKTGAPNRTSTSRRPICRPFSTAR